MNIRELGFKSLFSWFRMGFFAILDQGLFAGANFLMNILLARWFTPEQYGAFAIAFSVFLLVAAFHTAILTEPMMVFGAGKYSENFRKYLGMLIYGHLALMIPIGLIILAAALLLGRSYSPEVQGALLGLAVAGPMILLLWLVRRAFYVRSQPGWAALGGALYLIFLLGAVYFLNTTHWLSHTTALLGMGLSSIFVGLLFVTYLRPQWAIVGNPTPVMVATQHWRYGRWALGTAALMWFPGNIYSVILPSWIGLEGVAALRALLNLVMPILHAITALSILILPVLTRYLRQDVTKFADTIKRFLGLLFIGAILYLLGLYAFKTEVLNLLYGGKYTEFSSLVFVVGLLPVAASLTGVLGSALRAMERPHKVFYCYIASSIVALFGGVSLARALGIQGALLGLLFSSLATGTVMLVFYIDLYKHWEEA